MQRRNLGGARLEASERVILHALKSGGTSGPELCAWTLNLSHGGLRVVVEDPITVGEDYLVTVGEREPRLARVVWLREEADGQIAGMQFADATGGEERRSFFPPEPTPGS